MRGSTDLDEFFRILREHLHAAFPQAKSMTALAIAISQRGGHSADNLKRIYQGVRLPYPKTFETLLALHPDTERRAALQALYQRLRGPSKKPPATKRPDTHELG
jgi:hypothetical protein